MFSLHNIIKTHTNKNSFIVAYSGGLDSHVLLHLMFELKKNNPDITLQAIHINHQINPKADDWEQHCKKICAALNIAMHIETVNVNLKPGDSLEENARNARYDALKKHLNAETILLTAHHANDQAETFLLQALRGAGSKGLSAMPVKKKLGNSFIIRPLLNFTREQLEHYACENKLQWIEDDSNISSRFRRNFLRHEIFPLLKQHYPAVIENFSRSSRLIAHQEKIISDVIKKDFETIKTDDVQKIDLKKLREFSDQKQKLLLREWFHVNQLRMPNEKHLTQIQKDVINAAPDAQPVFTVGNISVQRDRHHLFLCCQLR